MAEATGRVPLAPRSRRPTIRPTSPASPVGATPSN